MRGFNVRSEVRARLWYALLAISLLAYLVPLLHAQVPGDVVAYWRLESLSDSTVATDETGQNNGTTVNGPAWTPVGRIGRALTFDGVNDKVQVTSPVSLQQGAFAISAWVRYTVTGTKGGEVASMGDSYALRVQPNGDVKTFFFNGTDWSGFAQSTGINTMDGEWHHIVGQYSGSLGSPAYHCQVYVDGALKDDRLYSGQSIVPRGSSFVLGQQGTGDTIHNFNGTIDQVRVYPRALTATEVSALYGEAPAVDPKVFTVLTWNTQKGRNTAGVVNLETIADKIIITGTDVALLSAVNNQSQVDVIKARLGIKWTCTFYQITTEGQAICSKYPLTNPDHHDVNVSGQTEPQAIVKATVTIGGRPVSFFAIDAQHDPGTDLSEVRRLQAVDMSAWADSGAFPEPRIVGGDFNEASGNGLSEWMTTYYDGWPNAASPFGYTTNSDGRTKSTRLDHILSSRGASAIVVSPPFVEGRVWDMRDFGTSCTQATSKIGSLGCSVCSSSPPPSNSTCALIDNTAVRPSDHIPFTMKFRFVQ